MFITYVYKHKYCMINLGYVHNIITHTPELKYSAAQNQCYGMTNEPLMIFKNYGLLKK